MRSTLVPALIALTLSANQVEAQRLPEPEIGFRAGFTRLSRDLGVSGTETLNVVALPGALFLSPGGIHFMMFVTPKVSLEPQVGFLRTSDEDASSSLLFLALQPNFFFGDSADRSGYIFANLGLLRESDSFGGTSASQTQNMFGLGLGYRRVLRRVVSTRYEVRYRQISNDPGEAIREFGMLFGLGFVIPRAGS